MLLGKGKAGEDPGVTLPLPQHVWVLGDNGCCVLSGKTVNLFVR